MSNLNENTNSPPTNLENLNKKNQLLKSTAMTTPEHMISFSKIEVKIMMLSLEGLGIRQIAELLNLSKHTIEDIKKTLPSRLAQREVAN